MACGEETKQEQSEELKLAYKYIGHLEDQISTLNAEVWRLSMIKALEAHGDEITNGEQWAVKLMVASVADTFDAVGGVNQASGVIGPDNQGRSFEVVVRLVGGKTPGEILAEYQKAILAIHRAYKGEGDSALAESIGKAYDLVPDVHKKERSEATHGL